MDPFELFQSPGIYKLAILYFSRSRGLAIVGRRTWGENVEVVQISGEVDPHTGKFTAIDYLSTERSEQSPVVITKKDFEQLVSFIESKIDDETRMSIIEPDLIRNVQSQTYLEDAEKYIH